MGEAAALGMAASAAGAGTAMTSLAARLPTTALAGLEISFATIAILAALVVSGQAGDVVGAGAVTVLAVAGSGAIDFAVAQPIYTRALRVAGLQRTYGVTIGLFILLTTVGGVVLLGERFTPGLPVGGALVLAGTYLIMVTRWRGDSGPDEATGDTVTVAAPPRTLERYAVLTVTPLLWTVATLWLASVGDEMGVLPAAALRMAAGTALLVAFLLTMRRSDLRSAVSRRRDVVTVCLASLGGICLGNLLYVYALIEAGAARTAILTATAPLFAIPFAIVFLREPLTRRVVLGTTLSVTGIIVVVSF